MTAQLDPTKPISAAMLRRAGACPGAVALVRKHFGSRRLRLTRARLRKAARLGLNMDWLARHLTPAQQPRYNVAMAEAWRVFDVAILEARQVFDVAILEARRPFLAATVEPWRVYTVAPAEAWRVYNVAILQARQVFDVALVEALADALGLP